LNPLRTVETRREFAVTSDGRRGGSWLNLGRNGNSPLGGKGSDEDSSSKKAAFFHRKANGDPERRVTVVGLTFEQERAQDFVPAKAFGCSVGTDAQ